MIDMFDWMGMALEIGKAVESEIMMRNISGHL